MKLAMVAKHGILTVLTMKLSEEIKKLRYLLMNTEWRGGEHENLSIAIANLANSTAQLAEKVEKLEEELPLYDE